VLVRCLEFRQLERKRDGKQWGNRREQEEGGRRRHGVVEAAAQSIEMK
jgi:hypothetical protein